MEFMGRLKMVDHATEDMVQLIPLTNLKKQLKNLMTPQCLSKLRFIISNNMVSNSWQKIQEVRSQ
jgi:hypothetical protein